MCAGLKIPKGWLDTNTWDMRKRMRISIETNHNFVNVFEATVDIKDMEKYEDLPDILQEVIDMLRAPTVEDKDIF